MRPRSLLPILAATFLAFAALYAPQTLLPWLAGAFGVSESDAATLISWSLLGMALAPPAAGLLLQVVAPRYLIAGSTLGLMLGEATFVVVDAFAWLGVVRFLQGACVAVLLAAVMTYIAANARRLQWVMSLYVGASIVGGLAGRLLAGTVAAALDWRVAFVVLTVLLAATAAWALRIEAGARPPAGAVRPSALLAVLRDPAVRRLYAVVFAVFFVFTALLNFLPFRLQALDPGVSEATVGLSYLGFVVGLAVALLAERLVDRLNGPLAAVGLGGGLVLASLGLAAVPAVPALGAAVVLAAPGFFLTHAVLAGTLNARAGDRAGAVNSMYVMCYYTGGALGAYVPGLVYEAAGWGAFVLLLAALALFGLAMTARSRRAEAGLPTPADA